MTARLLLLIPLYATLAYVWHDRLRPAAPAHETTALLREERLERLTLFLTKAPPETVQPILLSIALISEPVLEMVDGWLARPPLEQLRELTVQDSPMLVDSGGLRDALLLGWLGQEHLPALMDAHLMICAAGERLDDTMRLHALRTLADRARHAGDTRTALVILERAASFPAAPWSLIQSYADTAQGGTQPSALLAMVDAWLRRHPGAPAVDLEAARHLQSSLLIRSGKAAEALLAEQEALKALPTAAPLPEGTLQRALAAARATGSGAALMPWLRRQLESHPEHHLDALSLLRQNAETSPAYRHWLQEAARIADRELPAAQGYELCARLAATGEPGALARLCQLAEPARQQEDALRLLHAALGDVALRPALLALAVEDRLARRAVQEALQASPGERDLHYAATLAECAASPASAPTLWQAYLRRFPQDHAARRRLAQAHLAGQQPALALRVLDGMDSAAMTEEDLRQREILRQL